MKIYTTHYMNAITYFVSIWMLKCDIFQQAAESLFIRQAGCQTVIKCPTCNNVKQLTKILDLLNCQNEMKLSYFTQGTLYVTIKHNRSKIPERFTVRLPQNFLGARMLNFSSSPPLCLYNFVRMCFPYRPTCLSRSFFKSFGKSFQCMSSKAPSKE